MPYKGMTRPWVAAAGKLLRNYPESMRNDPDWPMDSEEKEGLHTGMAAVMYQEAPTMNAWFLFGSALLGIGSVRVLMFFAKREKQKERQHMLSGIPSNVTQIAVEREKAKLAEASRQQAHVEAVQRIAQKVAEEVPAEKTITDEEAVSIIEASFGGDGA